MPRTPTRMPYRSAQHGHPMNCDAGAAARPPWRDELRQYWSEDYPRFRHVVKVAIASTLAMGLCMLLELRGPATAMVSCIVVMMFQQSGMVIARGFYRGLGMLGGSLAGLLLVSLFSQAPWTFLLALAAWIGLCVFGSSYFRNFQSYGFLLTGYATAITSLPALSNPYGVFDNLVYTVSEVAIGVSCASLVSALVLPRRVAPELHAASKGNIAHLFAAVHVLLGAALPQDGFGTMLDLLRERANVQSLRAGAVFEDPSIRLQHHAFVELDTHFVDALASTHRLREVLAQASAGADERVLHAVRELIDTLLSIVPDGLPPGAAVEQPVEALSAALAGFERDLTGRLDALLHTIHAARQPRRMFDGTMRAALQGFVRDLRELCRSVVEARRADGRSWHQSVLRALTHIDSTRATADRAAAVINGVRAAAAVLTVGALWLASGWVGGSSALVSVAIVSALFTLAPDPVVASWQMFCGCVAGAMAGFLFSFFVFPLFDSFPLLAACLAFPIMVSAYLNTFTKTATLGLGFGVFFCYSVNVANPVTYHPAQFLDTAFGLSLGIAAAAVAFSTIVPLAGDWISKQYLKQIRSLVTKSVRDSGLDDLSPRFDAGMRGFIMRIASAPAGERVDQARLMASAFAALEFGRAIIVIRRDTERVATLLPDGWRAVQNAWLDALADVLSTATPEARVRAMGATQRAGLVLSRVTSSAEAADSLSIERMRRLMHFSARVLRDDTLSLWRTVSAARTIDAKGVSG
ncbi:Fusaric acid resistance protein conserved region (plasmid) [Paraburkholderia phymatum STM815]|uniref:Fusaric acid resistance protein conserved region n=2 Tax=Paraburkholderia phymatum TaxID=148447 RepID=B2JV07_PARP8|nr:Fusaric acid resistance protein conserved region [Paraburkholderia phymatum STM815]